MIKAASIFIWVICFAVPAFAQDKEPRPPVNTIDCQQFKKTGPQEWTEAGTAVFDLGTIKDINLTNQPVKPRYFKFGGFDLYTVVEQKCGALAVPNQDSATVQAPVTLQQATAPKPELEQAKSASPPVQLPSQASKTEVIPVVENKIIQTQLESTSCGDKKSVYIADGLASAEGVRGLIEIAFNKETSQSPFVIREFSKNKFNWTYTGKKVQDHLVFSPAYSKQEKTFSPFTFTSVQFRREKPVILSISYVKPHRNGTDEAILYIGGLRSLFASERNAHRFRFDGSPPSEFLPEAFYFDRCE